MEGKEKMYSPKISEEFIPYLYREAKATRIPMTELVNKIIKKYIKKAKKSKKTIDKKIKKNYNYCRN